MLNQSILKKYVRYEEKTGEFFSLKTGKKYKAIDKDGYLIIRVLDKNYRAARLAFLYMTGEMPKNTVDHIDRVKSNDAWKNLRDVTMSENKLNMITARKGNSSNVIGVSFYKPTNKYQAGIKVNGVRKQIGYFDTIEEASKAYQIEKNKLLESLDM